MIESNHELRERGTGIDFGETKEYDEAIKAFEIADRVCARRFFYNKYL